MNDPMQSGAPAIEAVGVQYHYGRSAALRGVDLAIPAGATYALLGANGSGKTTLLHVLLGLRRASEGSARVLGRDCTAIDAVDRQRIGYVGEGQQLPRWMRIREFEAYLRPLYPTWDVALADRLRDRFLLDPARKLGALSRGEYMKAALLFALAPHPAVLLMDEPFTGMDVSVKDELVRGLLDSAIADGCTSVICSHDLGELEPLADWVGFLAHGRMQLSEPMERMRERFQHVELVLPSDTPERFASDPEWMSVERAGRMLRFIAPGVSGDVVSSTITARFPGAQQVETRAATLREVFLALTERARRSDVGADDRNSHGARTSEAA